MSKHVLFTFILIGFSLNSCGFLQKAAKDIENQFFEDPPYDLVPGQEATDFFAKATGVDEINLTALNEAFSVAESESSSEVLALNGIFLAEQDESIPVVSNDTVNLMKEGSSQKANLDSEGFDRPNLDNLLPVPPQERRYSLGLLAEELPEKSMDYDPKQDTISAESWGDKTEILIPNLNRIPVRNQMQRGTCASFTGIGYLEYLLLKKYGDKVQTVDLSEQRFYMMSKADLWDKGGGVVDQDGGSAWEVGYAMSFGRDGQTSPTDSQPYNIPLEVDCPYNGSPGSNELQIPQANTCKKGVVKVKSLTESYQTKTGDGPWILRSNAVRSAQEIFDFVKDKGLPVPVGTILTANWMDNDGMITYAKSQTPGNGPHAGGHAYLIVGARKLDEARFPNEGGMCFVIKNSWGTGWGINGYSCMTLAWFNNYRSKYPSDVALDVEWDESYATTKLGSPEIATPTEEAPAAEETPATEEAPALVTVEDPGAPTEPEPITPAPAPAAPETKTTSDGFTVGKLLNKKGELLSVLFKVNGAQFSLKGVYPGLTKVTKELVLRHDNGKLFFDDPLHEKENVYGGRIAGDTVYLCSKEFASVCILNLNKGSNSMVIGVTKEKFLEQQPDLEAEYTSLFSFNNYGVDYHYPGGFHIDFKLRLGAGLNANATNPIRLKIKPSDGGIFFRGIAIGNLNSFELCSGAYKSVCRFIVSSQENTMNIFLKAKKKG